VIEVLVLFALIAFDWRLGLGVLLVMAVLE
jgi:hypothetical protein